MRYCILLLTLFWLPMRSDAQARGDSLVVELRDGTSITVAIADIQKITFDSITSSVDASHAEGELYLSVIEVTPDRVVVTVNAGDTGDFTWWINDVLGRTVYRKEIPAVSGVNHLVWDRREMDGTRITAGSYLISVSAGKKQGHAKLNIAQ